MANITIMIFFCSVPSRNLILYLFFNNVLQHCVDATSTYDPKNILSQKAAK